MSKVMTLSENVGAMSFAQGLDFIARTRRQLDRFDCLPRHDGQSINPEDDAAIRRICDELERDIMKSLSEP